MTKVFSLMSLLKTHTISKFHVNSNLGENIYISFSPVGTCEKYIFPLIRDITYKSTEFVLLMYQSVYGVFSSALKIYFAHRVLYENECIQGLPQNIKNKPKH